MIIYFKMGYETNPEIPYHVQSILFSETVSVEIFGLNIFLRFLKIRENIFSVQISLPFRGNTLKNTNINPCEFVNVLEYTEISRREDFYVHSNQ